LQIRQPEALRATGNDQDTMTNRYKLLPSSSASAWPPVGRRRRHLSTAPAVSTPDITARSAMMWRATTSTGRSGRFVLLDGGRFYFLYSRRTPPPSWAARSRGRQPVRREHHHQHGRRLQLGRAAERLTTLSASLDASTTTSTAP
jgi:hypothetical protein